ncbi:class II aldolase/adducin family protein [Carboxylicivirga marina]|uniref:class II aldolase/adducin family protein n=1 Tax=Carboxylicivirga marina TaxID=2800988 RepID=UPI0025970F81|nr:class II aldolase/adducin family protein [uncultured Carboxylicivirga sp.]
MEETYLKEKKEVAKWMRRLYKKGLTTSLGGNISRRIDDNHIAITASETDKGNIKASQIAVVALNGSVVSASLQVSVETGMHLAIYNQRREVNCIVHAHSPFGSLFAATNKAVNVSLLAEASTILGNPVVARYAAPGSEQLAKNVAAAAIESNVIIMQNHGVLAVGESILKAFDRIEVLENASKMTVLTSMLDDKKELKPEQISELQRLFAL